jgi:hypothetical protein
MEEPSEIIAQVSSCHCAHHHTVHDLTMVNFKFILITIAVVAEVSDSYANDW